MDDSQKRSTRWRVFFVVILAASLVPFTILLSDTFDLGEIVYFFLIVPALALLLLIFAAFKRNLSVWLALLAFCCISWLFWSNGMSIRTMARWRIHGRNIKTQILSQPDAGSGQLRHAEWDGWGGFGAGDTNVYVVFDPENSLRVSAQRQSSGLMRGVPCPIARINRLENQWYPVVLYTDESWDGCGVNSSR